MTIDEAIKTLRAIVEGSVLLTDQEQRLASQIGLQALLELKAKRSLRIEKEAKSNKDKRRGGSDA